MDELRDRIGQAGRWYRSSPLARQVVGGCGSLIVLVLAGFYFLFADQQL